MTTTVYSTYDAKRRFSEILRRVRGGEKVLVSYHGRTVAQIGPVEEISTEAEALDRLRARGVLSGARTASPETLRPVARIPGALQEFLDSRDE